MTPKRRTVKNPENAVIFTTAQVGVKTDTRAAENMSVESVVSVTRLWSALPPVGEPPAIQQLRGLLFACSCLISLVSYDGK